MSFALLSRSCDTPTLWHEGHREKIRMASLTSDRNESGCMSKPTRHTMMTSSASQAQAVLECIKKNITILSRRKLDFTIY